MDTNTCWLVLLLAVKKAVRVMNFGLLIEIVRFTIILLERGRCESLIRLVRSKKLMSDEVDGVCEVGEADEVCEFEQPDE